MRLSKAVLIPLAAFAAAGLLSLRAAEDPSVFHVNTQLVEVDVMVHGEKGPVAGLSKDDFTILDNGKPRQIALFSVSSSAKDAAKPSPLPPGVVSNRLTRTGDEPSSPTVILWDALNTETSDQAWVRNQVIKYLLTMKPGDPVAVYLLARNLRVIQDFTDDPLPLIQALHHPNAEQSVDLSAPDLADLSGQINVGAFANPAPAGAPANVVAQSQARSQALMNLLSMAVTDAAEMTDYALRDQVYLTRAALEAIAEHVSGLPGRKKLAWISGSFPALTSNQRTRVGESQIEVLDFAPQINQAIRALNGANVAVYPIDPRGVNSGAVSASAPLSAPSYKAGALGDASLTAPGIDTMNLLASGTGGKAFYATNDATGAIKTILEDGVVTYRLGFYPADVKMDGSYHALSVKVARKGKQIEDVRARKGYFALDAKSSANGHWQERLIESMQNPLEATQLGLRASAAPVEGSPGMYNLEITLDLEGLHLERAQNGRWNGAIALGMRFSPAESTKGSLETIGLSLTEDRLKAALKDGYVLRRKVVAGDRTPLSSAPGGQSVTVGYLRIVIEDPATGEIGSVSVPFGESPAVAPGL
jgi:VWFA-related protein